MDSESRPLAAENTRAASPLFGKLLVNKMAVMGQSFGGAGALLAANAGDNPHIVAAIGMSPIPPNVNSYSNDRLPSMIISADGDPYADSVPYPDQYANIPSTTTKALAYFKENTADFGTDWDAMHYIAETPVGTHSTDPDVARLGLSFLEVYLYGDRRYQQFIVDDPANMEPFGYVNP